MSHSILRRSASLTIGIAAAATLALAMPAAGGGTAGNPTLPPLELSAVAGPPGSSFTVSGTDCILEAAPAAPAAPGQQVSVTVGFAPTPVTMTTVAADGTGAWTLTFTVPAGTVPGPYPVTATCSLGTTNLATAGSVASVVAGQIPTIAYPAATFTVTAVPVPVVAAPRTTG